VRYGWVYQRGKGRATSLRPGRDHREMQHDEAGCTRLKLPNAAQMSVAVRVPFTTEQRGYGGPTVDRSGAETVSVPHTPGPAHTPRGRSTVRVLPLCT